MRAVFGQAAHVSFCDDLRRMLLFCTAFGDSDSATKYLFSPAEDADPSMDIDPPDPIPDHIAPPASNAQAPVRQAPYNFCFVPESEYGCSKQFMCRNIMVLIHRGGSAVGSTLRSGAQGPGFEPGLFHDAHDVPVLCQLAV
jgi:hypothetical protein